MSTPIPLPKSFSRLEPIPIDRDSLFATYADLTAYAAIRANAFPGMICSVTATNTPYIINSDKSVTSLLTLSGTTLQTVLNHLSTSTVVISSLLVSSNISAANIIYALSGNSNQWNQAFDISTAYQNASGSFATNTILNSVSSLLTPLTLTNSLTGQLVTNITFNDYQTNVANATATLLPTSIYQNASANWQSTFLTVEALSASWEESADIIPTVTNYLSTNNIQISALTVVETISTSQHGTSNQWNQAYDIATTYQSTSGSFATNTALNAASSILLPTSIYQNASGNWQSTFTTVQQNSSYWNAVSGITLSAANSYVNQNFLPLSGGTLTGGVTGTTIKLTDTIFTGKTVQAISLTGTAQFVEVEIPGGIKKYLQLFDITPPTLTYFVDFEDGVKGTYGSGTITLNGIDWNLTECLIGTLAQDWKDGLRSARLRGFSSSIMSMLEDKEYGLGTVSLSYDQYGTDTSQATWVVEYSMDSGVVWTSAGTFTATSVVQFFTTTINQPGNGRIRIRHLSGGDLVTNRRANVDNILITQYVL